MSMGRIVWGETNFYEEGVDQAALYFTESVVPWNGLISVEEEDTTDISTDHYVDGVRVAVTQVLGDFNAHVEAFVYPREIDEHDIYVDNVTKERFGLTYRTQHSEGYKIHVVYNAFLALPQHGWSTLTDDPTTSNFVWDLHASAVGVPGSSPASHLIIDTRELPEIVDAIANILYGTDSQDPRLPSPQEIFDMYEDAATLRITYNGDGTWTATGPDSMVQDLGDGTFRIASPSAFPINDKAFVIRSH